MNATSLLFGLLSTLFLIGNSGVGLAQTPHGTIKNVILIMADDLKASALGAYGDKICRTPHIDRLVKSGVVFEQAYCQGLACAPSRPSMLRGIYPKSKIKTLTIGEHFQNHSMYSIRVGKIFHMPIPRAPLEGSHGVDVPACWNERYSVQSAETFTPGLYRQLNSEIATRLIEGRQGAGTPNRMWTSVESDEIDGADQADYLVASKAIELLKERHAAQRPFFLAVGFIRPHYPMVQPKRFFDLYPLESMELPPLLPGDLDDIPVAGRGSDGNGLNDSEEGRRRMWQAYYASVSFMDEQLGRVLDELDQLGLRESTAIVFTTDHGYHLGEHGFWQKSNLHEEVVRVPLVVSAPGIEAGRTDSFVELIDVYPSCVELLELPQPVGLQGRSFVPILRDPKVQVRASALSIHNRNGGGLRSAEWHYMNYGPDRGEEFYDMVKDPHQYTNVAADPQYAKTLARARREFQTRMQAARSSKGE